MAQYKINANIIKIEEEINNQTCSVYIHLRGVSKFAYEKDKNTIWSILEGDKTDNSKFIDDSVRFTIDNEKSFLREILIEAMISKKSLVFTIIKKSAQYKITAVEMP